VKGIGRNEPCPCGSGKKHKRCCADGPAKAKTVTVMLIGLLLAALAGLVVAVWAPRSGVSPSQVWSAEHGHWHNVGGQLHRFRADPGYSARRSGDSRKDMVVPTRPLARRPLNPR